MQNRQIFIFNFMNSFTNQFKYIHVNRCLVCGENNDIICTQINKNTNVIRLTNGPVLLYFILTRNIRAYIESECNQKRYCKVYF